MQENETHPPRKGLIRIAVIAGLAALFTALCGLAILFALRRVDRLPLLSRWRPTASPAAPTAALTSTTPTPTLEQDRSATATPPATPASTPTPAPTPTGTPTPTPGPTTDALPTPFVCQGIEDLTSMKLAPGQPFECTIRQEALTALANRYEQSPCSETRIWFDDGEIVLQCRMGLTMSAVIEAQAQQCRLALRVLRGTLGFSGIVRELIASQLDVIRYDEICVEQVTVGNGEAYIAGRGR
jgi:hypothetical protein